MDASPNVQRFKNVTLAAACLARGGVLIRPIEEGGWVVFEIAVPADLDLTDRRTTVAIGPLLTWVEMLGAKVSESRRRRVVKT